MKSKPRLVVGDQAGLSLWVEDRCRVRSGGRHKLSSTNYRLLRKRSFKDGGRPRPRERAQSLDPLVPLRIHQVDSTLLRDFSVYYFV